MGRSDHFLGAIGVVLALLLLVSSLPSPAAASGGMLYLVKFKATSAGSPGTPEQALPLLHKLIIPTLEKLAKEERIQGGGLFVGARAGAFVIAARSHEEVTELLRSLPAWGVLDWKVMPLEGFAFRAEMEKKMVEELRAIVK